MAATARAFVLTARAKFNLRLEVGAVRADGLHAIRSVIGDLAIGDELAFLPSETGFSVTCDNPAVSDSGNLVRRAGEALGVALPRLRIQIKKTLPLEAGLGGGSADAAAALRGLAAILAETGVTFSESDLLEAANKVGADVPACLTAGFKIVEGAGEVVRPISPPVPHWGVLLLKPPIGVPTAQAYRLVDEARASGVHSASRDADAIDEVRSALMDGDFGRTCALAHNDFQRIIEEEYPAVGDARLRVIAAGAAATVLCGSGSCVAGLFENVGEAQKAFALIRPGRGEWAAATGFAHG